jgi:hypothetical protein
MYCTVLTHRTMIVMFHCVSPKYNEPITPPCGLFASGQKVCLSYDLLGVAGPSTFGFSQGYPAKPYHIFTAWVKVICWYTWLEVLDIHVHSHGKCEQHSPYFVFDDWYCRISRFNINHSLLYWIVGVCSTSLHSLYLRCDMSTNPK